MRIVVQKDNSANVAAVMIVCVMLGGAALYSLLIFKTQELAIGLGLLAVLFGVIGMVLSNSSPVLVIDETGIFDERLGIGKIPWSDVTNVQIEAIYGNRFLCLQVRDPEKYAARLIGAKREKVAFNQKLGFKRLNVEIGELDLSLLALKQLIDMRIR